MVKNNEDLDCIFSILLKQAMTTVISK